MDRSAAITSDRPHRSDDPLRRCRWSDGLLPLEDGTFVEQIADRQGGAEEGHGPTKGPISCLGLQVAGFSDCF